MKVLIIDIEVLGLPFAMRCMEAEHEVAVWQPPEKNGKRCEVGDGLVAKVADWRGKMRWADLVIVTGNAKYGSELEPFYRQGFPIVGANQASAAWELDRVVGQKVMQECGLDVLDFKEFSSYDRASDYVRKENKTFVSKPWGGTDDKSLSYVPSSPENLVSRLQKWKQEGIKGKFMLQEMVQGTEMAAGTWFGPGGFSRWINETWEEKRFMPGGYGPNTGEMGKMGM